MDERDMERGYADFHRGLNHVLRLKDVKKFKAHTAGHPGQAGRLSHCLGLNDELAEVELYMAILIRSPLSDLHEEAREWLMARGIEPPPPRFKKRKHRGKPPINNQLHRRARTAYKKD